MNNRTSKIATKKERPSILNGARFNDLREVQAAVLLRREDLNIIEEQSGFTALHYAVARGNLQIVRFLLSYEETEIHHVDEFGRSSLQLAVEVGHQGIVSELLKFRAKNY